MHRLRKLDRRIRSRLLCVRRSVRSTVRRVVRSLLNRETRSAHALFDRLGLRMAVAYGSWISAKSERGHVHFRTRALNLYLRLLALNLKFGVIRCSSV